jgi:ABC-type phosphate/phosphonate transport system substrate-binding protein
MSTDRIASLAMYDVDREAVQAWWDAIAQRLRAKLDDVPPHLTWPDDLSTHWRDPRLLLGQCCGYPLVKVLAADVLVAGAFRYGAPGCDGIDYRSEWVVRASEAAESIEAMRGRSFAFNARDSFSGWHGPQAFVAPLSAGAPFFGNTRETGSHRASLRAVRDGLADIAAIDCVTLELLRRRFPSEVQGVKTIGHTWGAPGLPLITSGLTPPAVLQVVRTALQEACDEPGLQALRQRLLIEGFRVADPDVWQARIGPSRQRRVHAGAAMLHDAASTSG